MHSHSRTVDNSSSPPSLNRHRFWRWFRRIYALATAAVLAWAMVAAWPALQQWKSSHILPGAIGSIAGWAGMVFLLGCGWAGALKAWSGLHLSPAQWLPMQAAAWVGRYLPGKLGLLAGKMQVCERGTHWKLVTGSVISEQIAFIASGTALSSLALPYWLPLLPPIFGQHQNLLLAALLSPLAVVIGLGAWCSTPHLPHAGRSWSTRLLLWSMLAHLVAGAGFHTLLASLLPSPPNLLTSIGLLAAAHTAGILAIFAPAGLGVREAVIAAALAPQLGWPQAAAVTALQRALVVIGDAGIALYALGMRRYPTAPVNSLSRPLPAKKSSL